MKDNNIAAYRKITDDIHELGIHAGVKGHEYVRTAIMAAVQDPSITKAITTRLYPQIANHYDTTPQRVERCIRSAVETGWLRGNPDAQERYFGWTVSADKGYPTNGEFIALLADKIRLDQGVVV